MVERLEVSGPCDIVNLSDEKTASDVISKSILGLWEVVNNLTRLRPTLRVRYRVTLFGSARASSEHWVYAAVRDLAAELTRLGCDIVTGGGPGLMEAAIPICCSSGSEILEVVRNHHSAWQARRGGAA